MFVLNGTNEYEFEDLMPVRPYFSSVCSFKDVDLLIGQKYCLAQSELKEVVIPEEREG